MEDKGVSEIQQLIGLPDYTLRHDASVTTPLEAWVPPPGRPIFSANDFYSMYANECTAFDGDSTARRAADTLHYIIEHRNDPPASCSNFLYNWTRVQGYHTRVIGGGDPSLEKEQYYELKCEPGTIDNIWKPLLRQFIQKFTYEKNHSMIVVGAGAWDLKPRLQMRPRDIEQQINATIRRLHESIPPSVLILWKSTAFNRNSKFGNIEPNGTIKQGQGGVNYLVYHANMVAKREIQRINSPRLVFLDWAKEVFPHMYNSTTFNLMVAENGDNNPWHSGPIPRGLLLQMMAWEVHSWKSQQQGNATSPYKHIIPINGTSVISSLPPYALNRTTNWRWEELLNKAIMQVGFMQVFGVILFLLTGTVRIKRSGKIRGRSHNTLLE